MSRYAMMGTFVLLTALFAALSGGFALFTGFKIISLAVPIGLLWGGFIFTLDRFIVSSLRKKLVPPEASAGEKIWIKGGELLTALPRLVLATFIAVTVSVPLEMKYFEPEINVRLGEWHSRAAKDLVAQISDSLPELTAVEQELAALDNKEKTLRDRRDLLQQQLRDEANGVAGKGLTGIPGAGKIYQQRLNDANQAERELTYHQQSNQARRQFLIDRLTTLRVEQAEAIKRKNQVREAGDGFLERFRALSELVSDGPARNVSLFLVVLLTLIETTPVLIKLFAKRGPYDELLETREHKIHVAQQVEISNFNSDTNVDLELYAIKSEARRQFEINLSRQTINPERIEDLAAPDIEEAQAEIAKAAVGDWKWRQMNAVQHT
ncbi:MAG TPA: DUF4407 domain-containing protein [Pyrinomonadaceae bacterium]